jgi:hypothetical protein
MIRLVRAESVKLWRPLTLGLGVGMALLSILVGSMNQEPAAFNIKAIKSGIVLQREHPSSPADLGLSSAGVKYQTALRQNLAFAESDLAQSLHDASIVGATQHPLGAVGLAAGFTASMLGGFVLLLCSWIGLVLLGLVSRHVWLIPQNVSAAVVWSWAGPQLARSLLVVFFFAALGVLAGVVVRNPLGAFFAAFVLLIVLNVLTRFAFLERFVPAAWIATWMGFERGVFLIDHVWAERTVGIRPGVAAAALLGLIAVLVGAAIVDVRRRDVLE